MKIISRKKWWFILHWKITLTENYKRCFNCIFVFWGTHSSFLWSLLCKKQHFAELLTHRKIGGIPSPRLFAGATQRKELIAVLLPWSCTSAALLTWPKSAAKMQCRKKNLVLLTHLVSSAFSASSRRLASASGSIKLCSFPTKK